MKERAEYIDIAKGIGMLLTIWAHIKVAGLGNTVVYSFHMPLFFFLSGVVYRADKYKVVSTLLKQRIRTLIIPYAFFSVISWVFWVIYGKLTGNQADIWMPLLQTVISQGSGGYLVHNSPLWFVTCLFCVEVLYWFLHELKINELSRVLISFIMAAAGCFMIRQESPLRYLPWSFDMALCALPFYAIGNTLMESEMIEKGKCFLIEHRIMGFILAAALLLPLILLASANGPCSMGHRKLGNPLLYYPNAMIGVALVIIISILFNHYLRAYLRPLSWIGKNSFYAMAVQTPTKGVVIVLVSNFFKVDPEYIGWSYKWSFVCFAISMIFIIIEMSIIIKCRTEIRIHYQYRRKKAE